MAWSAVYGEAEPQRLNRWLAQSGVCSRREAEALIARGLVSVDGEPVADLGRRVAPGQRVVVVDGAGAPLGGGLSVLLHKPVGIVSANPAPGQTPAVRLLTLEALWGESAVIPGPEHGLAPVGRLDRDSRGLLLLSEDGVVAKGVIGPASELDKEYRVRVAGAITGRALALLRHGLELDGRRLKPAEVERVGPQRLSFTLREGRNRQIRRMCELVGLRVVDLLRVRIGPVGLGDLPPGRWRVLTTAEREALVRPAAVQTA